METNKPVIVVNAAKAFVKTCDERSQSLRLSTEAIAKLNDLVRDMLKEAAKSALDHGQRTVLPRDL